MADDAGFLSRWSRRKAAVREGLTTEPVPAPPPEPVPAQTAPPVQPEATTPPSPAIESEAPPALTLDDVARLTRESDYSAFVAREVPSDVKNAALKKLFTDPHFNVMDGLDTYIEDYGKPDPLPPGMLRKMVQSQLLGLFDDEREQTSPAPAVTATTTAITAAEPAIQPPPPPPPTALPHEDADLQLQPDPAAGCAGAEGGAGEDLGRGPERQH